MNKEESDDIAERILFDWYAIEQGWQDSLPEDALDTLKELIAQALVEETP